MRAPLSEDESAAARARWEAGQPVTLRQFAAALGLGYWAAWKLTQEPGFPKVSRLIFRDDFERWKRAKVRQHPRPAVAVAPPLPRDWRDVAACKNEAADDRARPWPARAARLRALRG